MSNDSQNNQNNVKHRRKKRKGPVILLWVLILALCSLMLAGFVLNSANDIFGFGKEDKQIEVTVEKGMDVANVAKLLKDNGIIEQGSTFVLYSKIRNREGKIIEGDYNLNSNMSYDQIILAMKSGNTVKEEVKITFYEGMSALDIATLLEEKKVCDKKEFLAAVDNQSYDYEFENMLPKNKLRFRKLEGYLFPDTYDFYVGENVYSVLKKFVKNFQNKVFPEVYEEIKDSGMTLDDAITLASVIQEEASNEEEMYKVSSVFHNRMEDISAGLPMLQSDVTKLYVEKDVKPFQTKRNQEMYDAYNTYVCEGLPVGPICSPGLHAIRAAIKPDETKYYYFVTDANGKYYYSSTFNEHMANVRKAGAVKKAS